MILQKKTAQLLCARVGIVRSELTEEAQKLYDLFMDPTVSPEQKEILKVQLDDIIRSHEQKVETNRRLRGDSSQVK
jgi:hypothetical protein